MKRKPNVIQCDYRLQICIDQYIREEAKRLCTTMSSIVERAIIEYQLSKKRDEK